MESVGAFPCSELDSSMVPQFLDQFSFPFGHDKGIPNSLVSSSFSPTIEAKTSVAWLNENLHFALNNPETDSNPLYQQCGYSCNASDFVSIPSIPTSSFTGFNQIPVNNDAFTNSGDIFMGITGVNEKITTNPYAMMYPDAGVEETACVNDRPADLSAADALGLAKEMFLKRKFDVPELQRENANTGGSSGYPKKRLRVSRDAGSDGHTSCSYSSEDENGASESVAYEVMNSNGKARAARRGATDPQSIYARKRRERINERLRILQNLVPNGTKVDISTMLEEAVHYVKLLQLQIRLLSSDELWMYAPLANNGVDIGLHQKIFSQVFED